MGYFVRYGPAYPKVARKTGPWLWLAVVVGILLGARYHVGEALWEHFIPGDKVVTVSAVETLADSLSKGEPLGEAVVVFCQSILAGEAE